MTDQTTVEPSKDLSKSSANGIDLQDVAMVKVVDTNKSSSENGAVVEATAKILGQANAAVKGALLESGEELLTIPFQEDGFKFDQIFSDFASKQLNDFIFDDAQVHITVSATDKNALTVDFSGKLRINKEPMASIAKALNVVEAPLLTARIMTGDTDLSDKITPQAMKLSSAATLEVELFEGVSLTQTAFEIEIEKDSNGNWQLTPAASGTLQVDDLSSEAVDLPCQIKYADKKLFLNASLKEANDLFGVKGLTLDFIELDGVIGADKSLTINSAFTSGERTFELSGAVTNKNAGIFTKESKFTLDDLINAVESITGDVIETPDFDVNFGDVLFGFATENGKFGTETLEKGITVSTNLSVLDNTCEISTHFNQEGIEFTGDLMGSKFGPVELEKAELKLALYNKSVKKANSLSILGEATIEGIEVDCKVAYEKQNNQWQSILYGAVSSESLSLSKVFPSTKNSFVDTFSFTKAAFIYSSYNASSTDADFGITFKKGLQLVANMNQVSALNDLTGDDDLNLVLSAYLGTEKEIAIALPDTRLNLGKSVKTDPLKIGITLSPSPALELVFGMDLSVPKQSDPLHFDLSMMVGAIEASAAGTLKNYWENPFGIKGLKIGPALALEVGIIYQQFLATGTPSTFGFVGGLALGDVIAQMAMKISVDPADQILLGKLEKLSPANLVSFINEAASVDIPKNAIPDFFDIQDLELYVAPNGGSIGTVQFEPGFSFNGDLVIFGKEISLYARLSDQGVEAEGRIEKMDIGPLSIQGKKGGDAELDLELTTSKQSVLIDGEIQIFGSGVGIYADVSTSGVEFSFEQTFLNLATFMVEGKSKGNIKKPETLDFSLLAAFNSQITAYLKNDLTKKIDAAINVVNKDIGEAQKDVDKAEKAYKAEFNEAEKDVNNAQKEADKLLKSLQGELQKEKNKYKKDIAAAKKDIAKAEKAYNQALNSAKKEVEKAQKDYTSALSKAQSDVDKAKRDYTRALTSAQNEVKKARADYNKAVGSAQRSLDNAKKKVSSLQSNINSANKKLRKEKKKTFPNPFKLTKLAAEIAGLEVAKATATTALNVAKGVVSGVTKGAEFAAFNSANAALEAVKQGGKYTAFEGAKATLEAVKQGGKYTAFESAKAALVAVKEGSEYTVWQGAKSSLDVAEETGKAAIQVAQTSINTIGTTSVYVALEAAKGTLEAVKQGTAFAAFESADVALEAAKKGAGAVLDISKFVAQHSGDIIDIRQVELSGHLKGILKGDLFDAKIDMSVLGNNFKTNIDFDVQNIGKFIENLFKEVFSEAERIVKSIV